MDEKFNKLLLRHEELNDILQDPKSLSRQEFSGLSKEYAKLSDIAATITKMQSQQENLLELEQILEGDDEELKSIANDEIKEVTKEIEILVSKIKLLLIPKDEDDSKNVIVEIRAGTGGDEAALFAAVLFNMYQKYCERKKWKLDIISMETIGLGGYKEIIFSINGASVFSRLKFESGVHRVQRVPETESNGRIHTSAATVAVLPEAEDVDIVIEDKDLRIDIFRASGPGGQSVNTTDSAVRLVHLPTGITVQQQDEKSQHKNKEKAMKILKARIYDHKKAELNKERSDNRKSQVGTGDRSERIRTYNYPQGRVTDHRILLTLYQLDVITNEGDLELLINPLIIEDNAKKMANVDNL